MATTDSEPPEIEEQEGQPRWIDAHSVTCLLCGGLADERCSVNVWEDQITGAMEAENPETVELIREIIDSYGQGEAHPNCFDYALSHGLEEARESLAERDVRN